MLQCGVLESPFLSGDSQGGAVAGSREGQSLMSRGTQRALSRPWRVSPEGLCHVHLSWGRGEGSPGQNRKYSCKWSESFYFIRTRCIKVPGKKEAIG